MARTWATLPLLAALLVVTGCYTTERVRIRPPKREEVYALPPVADARFDEPLKYPKGLLNQDVVRSGKTADMKGPPGGGPNMGAGGGRMGGGAGMGGM